MIKEQDITKEIYILFAIFLVAAGLMSWAYAKHLDKQAVMPLKIRLEQVVKIRLTTDAIKIIERYKGLEIDKNVLTMPLYEFAFKIGPILNLTESHEIIENNEIEVLNAPQN